MKKHSAAFSFFIVLLSVLFLTACGDQTIYQKHKKIPDYIWKYEYKIPFNFRIKDAQAKYNTYLTVRNSSYYPFSNVWVLVKKFDQNGTVISEKKYEFKLADSDGRWYGDGLGDIIDNKLPLEQNISFPDAGEYTYYINHEMRTEDLVGLMDIGLSVEKISE